MRDSLSCFGENGVQVTDTSSSTSTVSKASQNLVTCTYQCKLVGKSCFITVSWSKNLMGHCLSVEIDDLSHKCLCKVDVKPTLFFRRKGLKCIDVNSLKIYIYWDLSVAKFGQGGPEPLEGFYVGIVCKGEMVLVVGDLKKEALKKSGAIPSLFNSMFVSKKEHIFGKKVYVSKAQFSDNGQMHNLAIECDENGVDDPCLVVRLDSKPVMKVRHLRWKFRGNHTILVDGLPVEIFWDVHNWLFGTTLGNAVFMFKTCLSAEKLWTGETFLDTSEQQWSCSQSFKESKVSGLGFCLTLYAWKNE